MSVAVGLNELPPEVLRNICERLFREPPEDNGQVWPNRKQSYVGLRAVLALARTSRVLHEHALDVLWDSLPGYGSLVFTLPSDAWTIEDKPHRRHQWSEFKTEQHLSIVRPLVDADLLRFHHYAPRVKRIISDTYVLDAFPPHVWRVLCQTSVLNAFSTYFSTNGHTPFPNLGVLHLSPKIEDPATYYSALPIFFNRNLRNISDQSSVISKQTDLSSYERMLSKLQEMSPHLLFFNAHPCPWFTAMVSVLSNSLTSFRQLVSVQVLMIPLTPQAVLHLATLPNLTDATFKIDESGDTESLELFADTSNKNYFHKLRSFSVDHQKSPVIPNILVRSISSPAVNTIRVQVNSWNIRVQDVKELISTIANRPGHRRLRSVSVTVHGVAAEKDATIDEDDLMPLYKLKNLVTLQLTVQARFAITNEMLRDMASSWRKMRKLHLAPGSFTRRIDDDAQPLATLIGLIPFAQLCPHLHTLALQLSPVPGYALKDVRPSFGRPHRALRTLNVGYSKIEERQVLSTAVFLSDVFPKVDIDCDWPFEESVWEDGAEFTEAEREEILAEAVYRERWNKVAWRLVPALAKVRKQERKWGVANGMTIPTVQVFEDE